jgi:hypothetical protein
MSVGSISEYGHAAPTMLSNDLRGARYESISSSEMMSPYANEPTKWLELEELSSLGST